MAFTIEESDQTEFNAGIATLMRLDAIKRELIKDVEAENYLSRYRHLAAYYLELVSILKDKEEEELTPKFKKHQDNYRQLKELIEDKKNKYPRALIDWLDDYEIELRNAEQRYGLNMPKKADPRFAMAGGRRR